MIKYNKILSLAFFGFFIFVPCFASAEQLTNPVARCADCGVMKYRGTYYITGTCLHGLMLTSENLTDWEGPFNFFQTKLNWTHKKHTTEMHAPALKYYNGKFYFYWNGIAYATADKPLGPYTDKSLNGPFDKKIDPFLFIDEDGKFYFYTVKFDRGNIIYGQEMKNPNKLKGKPVRLLDPRPGCWETLTGNILEGQEVIRHRNKYYMLYAANHTGVQFGNYVIGCAVSDSPLGFNESSKYAWPVMEQSDERIYVEAKTIIPWAPNGGYEWAYTTKKPPKDWASTNFKKSKAWKKGKGGFGWPVIPSSRYHDIHTLWNSSDIWMRLEFELSELPSKNLQIIARHLDSVEIYFNGVLVHTNSRWGGPSLIELTQDDIDSLRLGKNVIAVHCHGPNEKKYIDVGLIDPVNKLEDDIVWNTGQPNLLRGPNGFEWYTINFGMWNEGPHCQGISRTFFFDRELYIDGPTGSRPPQYQPAPYKATFSDNFETHRMDRLGEHRGEGWEYFGGDWRIIDNQAEVAKSWKFNSPTEGTAIALIRAEPAKNYLFQAWVKPIENKHGKYGVVAWQADENNRLIIFFDNQMKKLVAELCINGTKRSKFYPLSKDFNFSVYHKIRFEKNGRAAEVWVDDTRLTLEKPLKIPSAKRGRQGLFSYNARALYDAVVYTIGWDEFDSGIRGWKPAIGSKTNVKVNKKNGLVLDAKKNKVVCVKGDLSDCYEFSAQVTVDKADIMDGDGLGPRASVLPVYIDENNWLSAEVKPEAYKLIVTGKREGRNIKKNQKNLAGWQRLYLRKQLPEVPSNLHISASHCCEWNSVEAAADGLIPTASKASFPLFSFWDHLGTREWIQYDFNEPKEVSGMEVIWYDDEVTGGQCRTPESWELLWKREDGTWQPVKLKEGSTFVTTKDKLNVIYFEPVKTKALKMKIKSKKGFSSGLYEWTVLDSDQNARIKFADMHLKRKGLVTGVKLRFENGKHFSAPNDFVVQRRNNNGEWTPVKIIEENGDVIKFEPMETDWLRIKLMIKPGTHCQLARAHAWVESESSINVRSVKLSDKVLIMINGKQQLEIPGNWPESKVGVSADNCVAAFNGITCFQIE